MHIPDNVRIPVTVLSIGGGMLVVLSFIFLVLIPS